MTEVDYLWAANKHDQNIDQGAVNWQPALNDKDEIAGQS